MGSSSSIQGNLDQSQIMMDNQSRTGIAIVKIPLKIMSFGIVDVNQGGFKLSDPITGIRDYAKELIDLDKDYDQGVWKGKQALGNNKTPGIKLGLQIEGILEKKFNYGLVHEAVMINGIVYSYEKQCGVIKIYVSNDNRYQWKYKGDSVKSQRQIEEWIEDFNMNNSYHLLFNNCQDASDKLVAFATDQ